MKAQFSTLKVSTQCCLRGARISKTSLVGTDRYNKTYGTLVSFRSHKLRPGVRVVPRAGSELFSWITSFFEVMWGAQMAPSTPARCEQGWLLWQASFSCPVLLFTRPSVIRVVSTAALMIFFSGCSLAKNCYVGSYLFLGVSRVVCSCRGLKSGSCPFWNACRLYIIFPVQCDFEFSFYLSAPPKLVVVMDVTA